MVVFVAIQSETGNVHRQIARRKIVRQPAPALQREPELGHAFAQRNVDLLDGRGSQRAVGREAMVLLKVFHRLHQRTLVRLKVNGGSLRQVSELTQPLIELG